MSFFKSSRKKKYSEILPEDILIDSANLPSFDKSQLEGRVTHAVDARVFNFLVIILFLAVGFFVYSAYGLQVKQGEFYAAKAENNRFESIPIFAERGSIYDRNGELLVWNESVATNTDNFSKRIYESSLAMGNVLGYIRYPKKDKNGVYITEAAEAVGGVEEYFNSILQGKEGSLYIESDAVGNVVSKTKADLPESGDNLNLTIDIDLQKKLVESIKNAVVDSGYAGGAALVVDITDGSVLAAVTYPDFDSNIMTEGVEHETIKKYLTDKKSYFLNRYTSGLYAPGSIVKPVFALAALHEDIISPQEKILSIGQLSVPNPYQPGKFTIFKDWKAHGYTNVREAIAVSSDVYFYTIGGGVPGRKGLGITKLAQYSELFGLKSLHENTFFTSKHSTIPTPEWKKKVFKGEDWRLGDTYNSSIGQYGFSITPVQAVTMLVRLARGNDGFNTEPVLRINKDEAATYIPMPEGINNISHSDFIEIFEGMRMTVTTGTALALNFPELKIAGKTGTAQTGVYNQFINSWFVGIWPYTEPKYAMVYLLEKGDAKNSRGGTAYVPAVFEACRLYACDFVNKKTTLGNATQ